MKIRKIAALLLAGVMTLGICSCSKSEKTDWDYIADKGTFVAGITLFEPMNYYDENGELTDSKPSSPSVCEKLGVEAKFQEIEWEKKEIELNAKTIDAIWNGLTVTEERQGEHVLLQVLCKKQAGRYHQHQER